MKVIEFGEKLNTPIVLCLGYFGCMHKGHVKLLEVARSRAALFNAKVAIFTFSNNHLKVLSQNLPVVYTFDERKLIYQSLSVDYVISAKFDDAFRMMNGREYLEKLCRYNLKGVVCGFDHHCGSDRLDSQNIKEYLSGVCAVDIVDQISVNSEKVSTTLIRRLLLQNDVVSVNELLSEPYFVIGKVIHGRGVGKTLGFPTANVLVDSDKLLPSGVFGGIAEFEGGKNAYKCVVNIGNRPTFDINGIAIEANLIDYNGDLYGKTVKLSLNKYLRAIRKFDSAAELTSQLQSDRERVIND